MVKLLLGTRAYVCVGGFVTVRAIGLALVCYSLFLLFINYVCIAVISRLQLISPSRFLSLLPSITSSVPPSLRFSTAASDRLQQSRSSRLHFTPSPTWPRPSSVLMPALLARGRRASRSTLSVPVTALVHSTCPCTRHCPRLRLRLLHITSVANLSPCNPLSHVGADCCLL